MPGAYTRFFLNTFRHKETAGLEKHPFVVSLCLALYIIERTTLGTFVRYIWWASSDKFVLCRTLVAEFNYLFCSLLDITFIDILQRLTDYIDGLGPEAGFFLSTTLLISTLKDCSQTQELHPR